MEAAVDGAMSTEPMRSRGAALMRDPGGSQRATLLELVFDLVFVAAIALSSTTLVDNLSWTGALRVLLPLMAVWWVWSITTLLTDFYDPGRAQIQAVVIGTMLGAMILAAAVPAAFGARGLVFAGTYVTIHIGRGVLLVVSLRSSDTQIRALRFMIWFAVSGVFWIAGGFAQGHAREVLWGLALIVDYVSAGFRYPVPILGRVPLVQYQKAGEHLGERYQQFMILALGDLILVPTIKYSQTDPTAARTTAFLVTFGTTLLVWQIYVYRAGSVLLTVVNRRPGRVVRWAPYTHVIMVAGIVGLAASFDMVIERPVGRISVGWTAVIVGGAVLFLAGRGTFEYQVYERLYVPRFVWLGLLIGLSPVLRTLAPFEVVIVVALVLLGSAVTDTVAVHRARRRDPTSIEPPGEERPSPTDKRTAR
jgi:low temperature requirement protein LtrA